MKAHILAAGRVVFLAMIVIVAAACSDSSTVPPVGPESPFETFKDKADFDAYFEMVSEEKGTYGSAEGEDAVAEPTGEMQGSPSGEQVETNNQSEGVDEGDIIKFAGTRLVILRDQHLLVLDIGGGNAASPVLLSDTELDADFGTGNWGKGAWYDEMLVYDSHIVLIAYRFHVNIERNDIEVGQEYSGAIEILNYRMREDGTLEAGERVFIESNDYYSGATNYAARKIQDKLVVYSPFYVARHWYDETDWHTEYRIPYVLELVDAGQKLFRRTRPAIEYVNAYKGSFSCAGFLLHTVYVLDVGAEMNSFTSSAVAGDGSGVYYVNRDGFFLNISNWWWTYSSYGEERDTSVLYRISLGDSPGLADMAELDGRIPERFAMNEIDGRLQVVTQEYPSGDGDLRVRAMDLDVRDFESRTEAVVEMDAYRLSAVRFNGKYAIISAYGAAGTSLHLADFSGTTPSLEATSIAGFYAGLFQPYDTNKWVALGLNVVSDDSSSYSYAYRTNISLLEASSAGTLEELASFTMEGDFVWSEAFYNDHAFFFDPDRALFGVPYGVWKESESTWEDGVQYFSMERQLLSEVEDAVVQTGDDCYECWYGNSRVVRRGDYYYNLLGRQLKTSMYDAASVKMDEVSSLELFAR